MSEYNFVSINTITEGVKERKEERRKVLEAVRERRKILYKRFQKKMQLQVDNEML